jgi:hypothetical protein
MKTIVLLSVTVLLAGCGGSPPPERHPFPEPPMNESTPSAEANSMIETVKKDLGQRLDVSAGAIELARIEEVMWPDASLGCPQPDQMYAQVITPGYRIQLRVRGKQYTYHTDRSRGFILCHEDVSSAR